MSQKFKLFTIIPFLVLITFSGVSQNSSAHRNEIKWAGEFPVKNDTTKTGFLKKTGNFISGKKNITLKTPVSLVIDNHNALWITDRGIRKIIKIKNNSCEIPRVFKKQNTDFSSLVGLCLYRDNTLLFTDSHLNSIFLYDEKNKQIKTLNKSIKLQQPTGIAYSEITGEIWVVETAAHRISVFDSEGNFLKTIGKRGSNPGEFNFPAFIWIDQLGTIYVVDSLNFRIQIFDKSGKLITVFGKQGDGTGNFARPKGIATDSYGNIYVADALFHVIQIFDKNGKFLYSFGSQGRGKGQFWMPSGIFIDSKDNIYVADSYNSRIQIFKLITE